MKRTHSGFLAIASVVFLGLGAALFTTPARAATNIVCDAQGVTLNNYPLDGNGNAANTHAYRCKNTTTGTKPTDARTQELFVAIQTLPTNVKTQLKNHSVKYFYFNNRTEAASYFQNTAPYAGQSQFYPTTTRCGNTAAISSSGVIAVAVYDNCYFDQHLVPNQVVLNPDLKRVGFHESGHAFAFALSPGNPPDRRAGYVNFFNDDRNVKKTK